MIMKRLFFPAGHIMQLLLFCLFGVVLAQVSAFAPPKCEEDYHETCRTNFRYRSHHDWMPYANASSENGIKWRVILDQYDYQTLVGEFSFPQGVWKDLDEDKDGRSVRMLISSTMHSTNYLLIIYHSGHKAVVALALTNFESVLSGIRSQTTGSSLRLSLIVMQWNSLSMLL